MIPIAKPEICEKAIEEVKKVLKSGFLVSGKKVKEFEGKFADYVGVKEAVATNSGTAALHAALLTLEIGPGDEVITTPFSFIASSNCILLVGAKPIFADIDLKTYNIDPEKIEEEITKKTKAILPVHLFGQPCEMDPIVDLCEDNGLFLIEDACQAHGAEYKEKKVGSFEIGTFSFYATKNMAIGEGGMITTDDEELAERIRQIVDQGQARKYYHTILGYNFRMMEIQATIGIEQLKGLDERNERRIQNANFLTKNLSETDGIVTPFVSPSVKHVFHQYVIRSKERDRLQNHLSKKGIQTSVHYPLPIYKQPLYQKLDYRLNSANTEKAAREVLSLPVHPFLSKEDLKKIIKSIMEYRS